MSEYFRKYIKRQHYPVHYSELKFKTFFNNCILDALKRRQFTQVEEDDWNIYWCEKEFIPETLDRTRATPNTRVNHFRNYYEICRKDLLVKNLKKYKKQLEKENRVEEANQQKPNIGKSQGKGIFLFKAISDIAEWADIKEQPEPYIVQRYIMDPLLIGGKKFDMRIYALVTSYQPLVVYLNRSGFGRFTHTRYDLTDINNVEGHLTNVAVQKKSQNYDEERGGKWLIDKLRLFLGSKYGIEKADDCFYNVQQIIVKTLSSVTKVMMNDKRCFQLYGFDILIDSGLRPWLIEVNGSPSMTANTPTDHQLKVGILDDVFTILDLQKLLTGDEEQVGGFDLIYKGKPVKISFGKNNFSMLGCLNNRNQQLKKVAKAVALRFSHPDKKKDEVAPQPTGAAQKKPWGANNIANRTAEVAKRVNYSVEPTRLPKVGHPQTLTHVKFPQIGDKPENGGIMKKLIANAVDTKAGVVNPRYTNNASRK